MSLITLDQIIQSGQKLTPMMEQYYKLKKQYPDIFLLYRMGDFYEVFFEDAVEVSKILNITLTHRGSIGEIKIPMAGIPHHAASSYIDKLTSRGLKAAICEQIEDPKDAIGIVKRAVTQVVSPGMPYDLEKTEGLENRFIACAHYQNKNFQLVLLDYTTGLFRGYFISSEDEFVEKLKLYAPKEMITFMGQYDQFPKVVEYLKTQNILKTHLSIEYFDLSHSRIYVEKLIPSYQRDKTLGAAKEILSPVGALGFYITSTQDLCKLHHIRPFSLISEKGKMKISLATLKGLEILPGQKENYKYSMLGHLDKTITSMGSRFIKNLFLAPLCDEDLINQRLDLIQVLSENKTFLNETREELKQVRDIERILAKTTLNKATSSDTLHLMHTIKAFARIDHNLQSILQFPISDLAPSNLPKLTNLAEEIKIIINDEIGASIDKGNLIRDGFNEQRDRLKKISQHTQIELQKIEDKYKKETGIGNLKIKYNNVAGYFIEVSKSHLDKVPTHFKRKQTLVNAERYLTDELIQFEKEILTAKDKLEKMERELFNNLLSSIKNLSSDILIMAHNLAFLDTFLSLSLVACQEGYTRPIFLKDNKIIEVQAGFHPLIKHFIQEKFISHNLNLNQDCYFGLITGPNMAGKTTVMREMAIIQFLGQIGSFVPAKRATLSLCDYLFCRLGASDDITKGQSTFMVEMTEAAEIIRHATCKSFIILDELGRGTSTHDGLAIAWALTEHLIKKTKALCLFATHYHELIEVVSKLSGAKNLTTEIINQDGKVHFLYRLIEQGATESFGIYVAGLAGLPESILKRSSELLHKLESRHPVTNHKSPTVLQPGFFDEIAEQNTPQYLIDIENILKRIDPMQMTPIEALSTLDQIKKNLPLQ